MSRWTVSGSSSTPRAPRCASSPAPDRDAQAQASASPAPAEGDPAAAAAREEVRAQGPDRARPRGRRVADRLGRRAHVAVAGRPLGHVPQGAQGHQLVLHARLRDDVRVPQPGCHRRLPGDVLRPVRDARVRLDPQHQQRELIERRNRLEREEGEKKWKEEEVERERFQKEQKEKMERQEIKKDKQIIEMDKRKINTEDEDEKQNIIVVEEYPSKIYEKKCSNDQEFDYVFIVPLRDDKYVAHCYDDDFIQDFLNSPQQAMIEYDKDEKNARFLNFYTLLTNEHLKGFISIGKKEEGYRNELRELLLENDTFVLLPEITETYKPKGFNKDEIKIQKLKPISREIFLRKLKITKEMINNEENEGDEGM